MSARAQIISGVLNFAARNSPYYRRQGWARSLREGRGIAFPDIPFTPKSDLKARTAEFYAENIPASEGRSIEKFTSGSTGVPLRILKTQRHFAINSKENDRLSAGWGQEAYRAVVNTSYAEEGHEPGEITETRGPDGSVSWRIYTFASRPIADLLCRTQAPHFNSRPSVVLGTLQEDRDFSFLRLITTVSEIVSPELKLLIARLPQCRHFDSYGTVETGLLAAQCVECGNYHAAEGHAVIEVVDRKGRPVAPGGTGRVVVTTLFNLAMPLIRYDLEDVVTLAEPGKCRRPGQAFTRIIGRDRNLFTLPEGGKITPNIPPEDVLAHGMKQYKLIQRTLNEVELLYVPMSDGVVLAQDVAQKLIEAHVSRHMKVTVRRVSEMPRSKGGKFLMHESMV